jgi:protein ImuB
MSLRRRFPAKDAAEAALLRLDQALGQRPEPASSVEASPVHMARRDFAEPLITAEGVGRALDVLAKELAAHLSAAQKGARRILFRAYRVCGGCAETRAGLSVPSRDPGHFLRLLRDKIEGLDVGFGVDGLSLSAEIVERLAPSQRSFAAALDASLGKAGSAGRAAAGLPELIDRLANKLGPARVLRLSPQESWLPERTDLWRPALAAVARPSSTRDEPPFRPVEGPPRPLLLLKNPEPIDVVALLPEGPPRRFLWRRAARRVTRAQGPERIAPEWWREIGQEQTRTRDYYRVEDEDGRRYWLFREGLYQEERSANSGTPRWWLQGVYG